MPTVASGGRWGASAKGRPLTFAIGKSSTAHGEGQKSSAEDAGEARRGQATASAEGDGDVGLSKPHSVTPEWVAWPVDPEPHLRGGRVILYDGGCVVEARRERIVTGRHYGGGIRGKVTGFSWDSRRRLMRLVGIIDQRGDPPLFVTLTYPAVWPTDGRVWKRHLTAFGHRLKRKFGEVGFIWKLEAQKRGAPHFHLLVWGVSYTELLSWASRAWFEVVGSGDVRHLHAGTQVQWIRSWRGVMSYASKYLGKVEALPEGLGWEAVGRMWGIRGAEFIPWASPEVVGATDVQLSRVMRALRRSVRKDKRQRLVNLSAIMVFVGSASFWLSRLDALMGSPF